MNIVFLGDHRIELYLIYDCAISMISCSLNFLIRGHSYISDFFIHWRKMLPFYLAS